MNLKLAIGIAVAIVAGYSVLVIGIVRKTSFYESYHRYAGIAISSVGAVSLAVGSWKRRRTAPRPVTEDNASTEAADEPTDASQHFSLLNSRYVCVMCMILGLATVFIIPLPPAAEPSTVHAAEPPKRPVAKSLPTNPPPVVEPAKPAAFPAVRVQGIYFRPERPSALINGKTYFIGERVQDAKVVAITRDSVLLEIDDQQRVYLLEE
jgi:hypothetical protein